ncbi:hypothetical protein ABPG75_008766 [Micractinium tetrahymenae]
MGKNVYAVVAGRRPGLYKKWEDCLLQVKGFPGNRYKGFVSEQEALRYLQENGITVPGTAAAAAAAAEGGEAAAAAAGARGQGAAAVAAAAPRKRRAPSSSKPAAEVQHQRQRRQPEAAAAAPAAGASSTAAALPPTGRVLRLEFDGASKRNPGPAGFGAVLYDDATNTEVARLCQYMGDLHTNNQAEYAGLIAGLQAALELGCSRIRVHGDSTLIIRQVMGEWRVKNEELQRYHAAADTLRRRFESFEARQVLREYNKVADALSNQAIEDYRSGANPHLWRLDEAVAAASAAAAEAAAAADAAAVDVAAAAGADAASAAVGEEAAAAGAGSGSSGGWLRDAAAKRPRLE